MPSGDTIPKNTNNKVHILKERESEQKLTHKYDANEGTDSQYCDYLPNLRNNEVIL